MRTEVTTYYLEMLELAWLHASSSLPETALGPWPGAQRSLHRGV
jgi:hypothetical protein